MVSVTKVTLLVTLLLFGGSTISFLPANITVCTSTGREIPSRIHKRMNGTGFFGRQPAGRYTGRQLQLVLYHLNLLKQIDANSYQQRKEVFDKLELIINIPYGVSTFRKSIRRLASRNEKSDIYEWLSTSVPIDARSIVMKTHNQKQCRNHILKHTFNTEKLGNVFEQFEELSPEHQNLWFDAFDSIAQDRTSKAKSPTSFKATDEEDPKKGIPYLSSKPHFTTIFSYLQEQLREDPDFITPETINFFIHAYDETENVFEEVGSSEESEVSE